MNQLKHVVPKDSHGYLKILVSMPAGFHRPGWGQTSIMLTLQINSVQRIVTVQLLVEELHSSGIFCMTQKTSAVTKFGGSRNHLV